MSLFSKRSLSDRVEAQRDLLDEVFGRGSYEIEAIDSDGATVRSQRLEWRIGVDPRDGSFCSLLTAVTGEPWEEQAIPQLWAQVLGDEPVPLPRDASGRVILTLDEQIARELQLLRRLTLEIFADPQRSRDAAFFVRG